jgi:uncharacterized membrane protein
VEVTPLLAELFALAVAAVVFRTVAPVMVGLVAVRQILIEQVLERPVKATMVGFAIRREIMVVEVAVLGLLEELVAIARQVKIGQAVWVAVRSCPI